MEFDVDALRARFDQYLQQGIEWATSPDFYAQIAFIVGAIVLAFFVARVVGRYFKAPAEPIQTGSMARLREFVFRLKRILFPVFTVGFLGLASSLSGSAGIPSWLITIAQSLAIVNLIYRIATNFIESSAVQRFVKWVFIPIAVLWAFGSLNVVTAYMQSVQIGPIGNISISLYGIVRVLIFGSILFWLGRKSNDSGKQYIRNQEAMDIGTREVLAKLFEIILFVIIFIVLLQIMGINITALAVLGGAVGVGIGFGLQAIASNFISGLIILLDRSITVGDYIELEDGRTGTIRALNMRCTILETFDGKDVVVPNETFITSSFINWTHKDIQQRYAIEFQVAYDTDMEKLVEVLKELVAEHPQVLSGPDVAPELQPDAEISGFGDSGVNILIEFWMDGIDDGLNRVDADLNMAIWKAMRQHGFEFPFPQREIRILNQGYDAVVEQIVPVSTKGVAAKEAAKVATKKVKQKKTEKTVPKS